MSNRRRRGESAWASSMHSVLALLLVLLACLGCGRAAAGARSAASESEASYGYSYEESAPVAQAASVAPAGAPPPPAPPLGAGLPQLGALAGTPAAAPVALSTVTPTAVTPAAVTPAGKAEAQSGPRAPLLIYTATLTMAVFAADAALDAVERLALDKGGYLVRRSDRSITIRVPAESFREALDGVGKLGDELHRDVNAQDVTDEFADLQIRLRNAEVVRQRLEVLLERASKVDDALAVERELERVTRDIEQIKGRLARLGELIRFSTITVNFEAMQVEAVARDNPLPFEWLQRLGLPHLLRL